MARKGGNPNIRNVPKTGAKTKEGKLKSLVMSGNLKPTSKSLLLKTFSRCNKCPLRPRVEHHKLQSGRSYREVILPARCSDYKEGKKCSLPQGEFIDKLKFYYEIGQKKDLDAMQQAVMYEAVENMMLAKKSEIMEKGRPSNYTLKFNELLANMLHNKEKIMYGEKQRVEADVNQKVATLDIGELLKDKKKEMSKKGKYPWEEEDE